jgi:hypothetical protein
MEQWVEMDDAEKLIAVKAHSLGKNLLEHERSRYDHVDAMTERGQRLVLGLPVMAILVLGIMLYRGLTGVDGSGWWQGWIWTASIFIGLIALFSWIAVSEVTKALKYEKERLDRSIQAQDYAIPKYE